MATRASALKRELIDRVAGLVRERVKRPDVPVAETFVRQFYANVPPEDILDRDSDALYGAALAFVNFGRVRPPGEAKIRVYNPRFEEYGWQVGHTVVEIITDDMPFLVDSVTAELNRQGLTVHLVIHPIFRVRRDRNGNLIEFLDRDAGPNGAALESFMHFEVDEHTSPEFLREVERGIERVLRDVRAAVEDWPRMREKARGLLAAMEKTPPDLPEDEVRETREFLRWMEDDHFTFIGYREYRFSGTGARARMNVVSGSGLGILRSDDVLVFRGRRNLASLPPDVRAFLREPKLLNVTKANLRSTVHRATHLDVVSFKKFDPDGTVTGEVLFLGLFTSTAYSRTPRDIPFLRRKIATILERSGFPPNSHDRKALQHILETYPRDELFQISDDDLFDISMGILHLQERQRFALFVRKDSIGRFVSCLVYVPRERFSTDLRLRMQDILARAFNGRVSAYYPELGHDAPLARVHFIVATDSRKIPDVQIEEIEAQLVEAGRTWSDKLREVLVEGKGEEQGLRLFRRYENAFASAYQEQANAHIALIDIERIEETLETGRLGMNLYRPIEATDDEVRFKIYHAREPVPLSDILPMLENMGLKVISEIPHVVEPAGTDPVSIHDFGAVRADGRPIDIAGIREAFQEAFGHVWNGDMENDGFNRLVVFAEMRWRDVVLIRALCKYLRQARITFSQTYMEQTLANNPAIARMIAELFRARFDPALDGGREEREAAIVAKIEAALEDVSNLDEDRILRRFVNVVQSMLRTNFFQTAADGGPKPYLSFKLDSHKLDELPEPRPLYEIFVYSPRVEAIHLRGGKVARGGIRWSDRREDFRTEVLGLVKAQMVKNAVIVPVGSKGGFVVKRPPSTGGREALLAEGVECYKTMMRGLLDLTDNIRKGKVVPPPDVVRHDDDDPYLVVAADKGTATFSDIANSVSRDEYGFWLDDAFASGGSAGYDHKKMGITARGAWESVKRHFRELGKDIQKEDFTVIGIGDMSGDVFGNGMLLSRHIKLIAAFNHMHIFVDPDPDPARSWAERKRLFDTPRTTWADYDPSLISKGGGVFERRAKSIRLTPEIKRLCGLSKDKVAPAELIQALLKVEADLLWFGGIGTFVKAHDETHAEAGDRANDAVRVDARDLRVKVVGEGANLGITQRGRIEFALRGGRINTDAIDNSAGVDCSDHEVNIKILLGSVIAHGDMTMKQRDRLLQKMTDEVAELVLRDNYLQTERLSLTESQGVDLLDYHIRLMRRLERAGRLDREIEFLPDDETLEERQAEGIGLTRPELSVLLAYSKLALFDELLPSDLPDDPQMVEELVLYFPKPLRKKFRKEIERHSLRREIIATCVTNSVINRGGITFVWNMMENTGLPAAEIARAYSITREVFGLRDLWAGIEALDNKVPAAVQIAMMVDSHRLIDRATLWFLHHCRHPLDVARIVGDYTPAVARLAECLGEIIKDDDRELVDRRVADYVEEGVPEDLARRVAHLDLLVSGCDIASIARGAGAPVEDVGRIYFAVGARFGIDWLRNAAERLQPVEHWEKMAVAALIDDLFGHQRDLTTKVMDAAGDAKIAGDIVDAWVEARAALVARTEDTLAEIRSAGAPDLARLAVASRQFKSLIAD